MGVAQSTLTKASLDTKKKPDANDGVNNESAKVEANGDAIMTSIDLTDASKETPEVKSDETTKEPAKSSKSGFSRSKLVRSFRSKLKKKKSTSKAEEEVDASEIRKTETLGPKAIEPEEDTKTSSDKPKSSKNGNKNKFKKSLNFLKKKKKDEHQEVKPLPEVKPEDSQTSALVNEQDVPAETPTGSYDSKSEIEEKLPEIKEEEVVAEPEAKVENPTKSSADGDINASETVKIESCSEEAQPNSS